MVEINKLAVGVIALSALVGLSPVIADELLIKKQSFVFDANATVIEEGNFSLGVVAEPDMRFGRIPAGSGSAKFLNISAPEKTVLSIDASGNISDYLSYPEEIMFKGQRDIEIHFNSTEDTPKSYYSGQLEVKTETTERGYGQTWLETKYWFYQLY